MEGRKVEIDNCHVETATMNIYQNAGGLVGRCPNVGGVPLIMTISNCSVDALTMTCCSKNPIAYSAPLFGQFAPVPGATNTASLTISGCSVTNTSITGVLSDNGTTPDVTPYDKYLGHLGGGPTVTYENRDI